MVTINPADCRPDEVYEGVLSGATNPQPRVMQRLGNGQERGAWKVLTHDPEAYSYYSDIDVIPLVRLVPAREVTRQDLPSDDKAISLWLSGGSRGLSADAVLDAVVAHLNANGGVLSRGERQDLAAFEQSFADERARAEKAELERDEAYGWRHAWRRAHAIVEQERDQAREQWKKWEHKADEWKARAEAAEARTAVTRDEVLDAVTAVFEHERNRGDDGRFAWPGTRPITDAVCALFGVEAEQPDPLETKARELYGAANAGTPWGAVVQSANEGNRVDREVVREYRAIAAHVLGQGSKR